jgi:hypothetical protein
LFRDKNLSPASLAIVAIRHKLIGYIFKIAAQHPKLESYSLEKMPDNIAVSFLPDFESGRTKGHYKGGNIRIVDTVEPNVEAVYAFTMGISLQLA